jgi:GT2 family glycosyltransferase
LGARHASEEILFFVDADVALPSDAVAMVTAALSDSSEVDALIGSYDDSPPESDFFSRFKNLFHHYTHQNSRENARTFWGACGAIRREVFQQVGGFDPSYRKPSVEDIELGGRLHRAGFRIRLLKSLQVTHLKRWGRRGMITTDIFHRAIPWTRMILRQQALPNDLNLTIVDRISALMALGIALGLAGAAFRPLLLMPVAGMALLLLTIHRRLYRFFHRKGGAVFAARGILWHWIYYLYSLAGFGAGILYHAADKIGIFRTSSVSANSGS